MKTEGKVIAINSDAAIIEVKRKSTCGENCAHCNGCESQTVCVEAFYDISIKVGDWVLLHSDEKLILFGFFILFILPLFLPLLVYALTVRTGFGWIFAVCSFLLSVFCAMRLNKDERYLKRSKPYILEIIKKEYDE